MKKLNKLTAFLLAIMVILTGSCFSSVSLRAHAEETTATLTPSQQYVANMGAGWNLGNTFDGFIEEGNGDDQGEESWGNPKATKELIQSIKDKGFNSIRMPLTIHRRYTVNEDAKDGEYTYVIDKDWLARYKEVVGWANAAGLYVMINIHHDSWIWLKNWDGKEDSKEYQMYTEFWKQLAAYFADQPKTVCFETINEPQFADDSIAQENLDKVNLAAYQIIRNTKGNEKRMIVMPTLYTRCDADSAKPLSTMIEDLKAKGDENLIATVHYYCEWVFSANLGRTGFDEELWKDGDGNSVTPRTSIDSMMNVMKEYFLNKGTGVIVGEYGLLGYDASPNCIQTGEELKYYEYMNYKANQNKMCLVFWDNGSGIDRNDKNYAWKKPIVGNLLETSIKNQRSSYATGLNELYFNKEITEDVKVPLTLNGNTFSEIAGLKQGTDYTYDEKTAVVTLKKEYINAQFAKAEKTGTFADLVFHFRSGADWHEYLIKNDVPVVTAKETAGTKTDGIAIPLQLNGNKIRRVTAYQLQKNEDGTETYTKIVGPNNWSQYLQYGGSFDVDYENETLKMLPNFFNDASVENALTKIRVEFYDGETTTLWMNVADKAVTSDPALDPNYVAPVDPGKKDDTNPPAPEQPKPAAPVQNTTQAPATTTQAQTTTEAPKTTQAPKQDTVAFVKNKVSVKVGDKATLKVTASSDKVTYTSSNKKVVSVTASGKITAKKAGTAIITATCNTATATCKVTVKKDTLILKNWKIGKKAVKTAAKTASVSKNDTVTLKLYRKNTVLPVNVTVSDKKAVQAKATGNVVTLTMKKAVNTKVKITISCGSKKIIKYVKIHSL